MPRTVALQRLCLALAAAAALVWLAVSLSDARALERATKAATGARSSGAIAAGLRDASHAGRLHPGDTAADIQRGRLLVAARRPHQAAALLERVVREEPRNGLAWVSLALAQFTFDLPAARRAAAHVIALDPLGRR